MNKKGFTLVELVVVVSILAILGAIGFSAYTNYIKGVRDSNRITQLNNISESLKVLSLKGGVPLPDDYVSIKDGNRIIGYQGYAGKSVLERLGYSSSGIDPKSNKYFVYYVSKNRKIFQLLTFLEEKESLVGVNASYIYSDKIPYVDGYKVGVLTNDKNIPINEIVSGEIDFNNNTSIYRSVISNDKFYDLSGEKILSILATNSDGRYNSPAYCPDGYISVPGNYDFKQKGFCVSKYEMGYSDGSLIGVGAYNLTPYDENKKPVSLEGVFPIGVITQSEAIDSCKSLGLNYSLVNNNQWMSIARSIEIVDSNWAGGKVGEGFIYTGLSNNSTTGCESVVGGNTHSDNGYGTKTGIGLSEDCNEKRKLELTNGEIIWDFAGNMREHVDKSNGIIGGFNSGNTTIGGASSSSGEDNDGIYSTADMKNYGSLFEYGIEHGMGNINGSSGVSNNIFVRGGHSNGDEMTGIYSLDLMNNNNDGEDNNNSGESLGFRCVYQK